MENKICKKRIGYVVTFILIASSLLPLFIVGSAVNTSRISKNQNPTYTIADDTEYWALLVGVGDYAENPMEDRPDMILEVNDFHAQLLQSDWWAEDHIKVITGEEATIVNIIAGLRWLDRMEDSDDISLVYLSTHGFPLDVDIPPADEADGMDEALVSYWGFSFPMLFIWDDELNVLLNRLESKGVCLIVDSCYAGGFNDPPNWNKTGSLTESQQQNELAAEEWVNGFGEDVRGQKRVIIMASCEDEVSFSGAFGPYLIDGLRGYADTNGDGIVSAEEVFVYAEPRSPRQHPTIFDGYDGELPLINTGTPFNILDDRDPPLVNSRQDGESTESHLMAEENSIVCGYIRDVVASSPIENAVVSVRGRINEYEYYENQTTTNTTGFYLMHTPAIRLRVTAFAEGYCERSSGWLQVQENETQWVNLSLYERPPETAIVCGYIREEETANPLEMVNVSLSWQGNEQQYYQNETTTDTTGFYQMNVAAGTISLYMEKEGYFSEHIEELSIEESETLWVNVSLSPRPTENAIVCGYVTDRETQDPLGGARIGFEWMDVEAGANYEKETQTNASGFYSIHIAPGELYINIREMGYEYYDPYRHDAAENATVWVNCSVTRSTIEVELNQPLNALYVKNQRIMPCAAPRIIGSINVSVYIPGGWEEPGDAEKVEFYIDGNLQATLTEQPFNWTWSKRTFGKHIIKVIVYDFNGDTATKEIEVTKFL